LFKATIAVEEGQFNGGCKHLGMLTQILDEPASATLLSSYNKICW